MHSKVKITHYFFIVFWNIVIIIVVKKFLTIYIVYSSLLILISLIMKKLIYTKVDHLFDMAHIKRKIFCRKIKNNTCPCRSYINKKICCYLSNSSEIYLKAIDSKMTLVQRYDMVSN